MLLTAGLAAFTSHFSTFIPEALMQAASFVVSFAVVSVLFTLMFKWLPDAEVEWRDVWLGGVGTGGAVRDRQVPDQLLHRQAGT